MQLRSVNSPKGDTNRFCGPSAISALTGMTTGEAARLLRHVSGRSKIMGASTRSVINALRLCGIRAMGRWTEGKPTLAGWLKATHGKRGGRVFLIVAGNHFQLVSGNRYVCGLTKDVVELTHPKVKRRARVTDVYELKADAITIPAQARKPKISADPYKAQEAKARREAHRLAARIGVEIERHADIGRWYVSHPDLLDTGADPWEGDHYAEDWRDALERVRVYEQHLAAQKLAA